MNTTRDLLNYLQIPSLNLPLVQDLIALLPDAALLIHLEDDRILAANDAAITLTAYTRPQLKRIGLSHLLPDYNRQKFPPPGQFLLHAANGRQRLTQVYFHPIGKNTPWGIIILRKVITQSYTTPLPPAQWTSLFLKTINQIVQLTSSELDKDLWPAILRAIQPLTETRLLALYHAAPETPSWQCRACLPADENFLPATIPAHMLMPTITIWQRGEMPQSPLHAQAAAENYHYLATAPILENVRPIGYLVVGDPERRPHPYLTHTLQALAAILYAISHHLILQGNLSTQVKALSAENIRHQRSLEYLPLGLIYLSPRRDIEYMNPAAETMLGYALQEVHHRPAADILIGPENLNLMLERASQHEHISSLGNTTELYHRSGRSFAARIRIAPLPGTPVPLLITLEDISERREFEIRNQQLEQRAMLGEITAIFAHEVRNPVNNISMGLQLLAANLPADNPNQEHIGRMLADCNRLTMLMQSVLNYFHADITPQEVLHLDQFLKQLLDRWQPRCTHQQVKIHTDFAAGLPPILGHPASLERVFNNLFSNALRAMPDGGQLSLRLAPDQGHKDANLIHISVADTGIGIPEELQERIFAPFFTTDHKGGTGLGLAIAQRIVTAHRGNIQVQSYPGGGTVFHLFFPAHKESA